MDDQSIPIIGEDLDLTKIPPLNQQRSVSFLNHFILRTSNFLNKFGNMAETELMQQSLEIQNIETALNILEAKLDSIPGLENFKPSASENQTAATSSSAATNNRQEQVSSNQEVSKTNDNSDEPAQTVEVVADPNVVTVKQDPRFARFFKMLNVGVPKGAVVTKMMSEGLDPNLLDTPDAAAPQSAAPASDSSDNESQSLSSGDDDFSD